MNRKIQIPWQIRMPGAGSGSPRKSIWWNRRHVEESVPSRSVSMKQDDLDHLGCRHKVHQHLPR